jgi:hypothetical protein
VTTFTRRGHFRDSPRRATHWVNEHEVTRDHWDTSGWDIARAPKLAAWVGPNARCPVCGCPVYFYSNAGGSRVFFDELGKPWPKHPCTDNTAHAPYELTSRSPVPRSPAETRAYKEAARNARIEIPSTPNAVVLVTISASADRLDAVPVGLDAKYTEHYRIIVASQPQRPRKGELIYRCRDEISFFHRPTSTVVSMTVSRSSIK